MKRFFSKNSKNFSPSQKDKKKFFHKRINLREWSSQSPSPPPHLTRSPQQAPNPGQSKKNTIQDVINHFMKTTQNSGSHSAQQRKESPHHYTGNYKDDLSTLKNDSITVESNRTKADLSEINSMATSTTPVRQSSYLKDSDQTLYFSRSKPRKRTSHHVLTLGEITKTQQDYFRSRTCGGNVKFNTSLGKRDEKAAMLSMMDFDGQISRNAGSERVDSQHSTDTLTKEANNVFSISNSYLCGKNKSPNGSVQGETPNFKVEFYRSSLNLKKTKEIEADIAEFVEVPQERKRRKLFSKKSSTNLGVALSNKLNFTRKNAPQMTKTSQASFTIEAALKKIKSVESVAAGDGPQFRHNSTIENHFKNFEIVSVSDKDNALQSERSISITKSKEKPVEDFTNSLMKNENRKFTRGLLSDSHVPVPLKASDDQRETRIPRAKPKVKRVLKKNNTHRFDTSSPTHGKPTIVRRVSPVHNPLKYRVTKQSSTSLQNHSLNTTNSSLNMRLSNLISKLPKQSEFFGQKAVKKQSQIDKLISSKIQRNLSNFQRVQNFSYNKENSILKHKQSLIPNNINLSFAKTSNKKSSGKMKASSRIRAQVRRKVQGKKTVRSGMSINTIDSIYLNNPKESSPMSTNQSNKATFTKYSIDEYNRMSSRSASLNAESLGKKEGKSSPRYSRQICFTRNKSANVLWPRNSSSTSLMPRIVNRSVKSKSVDQVPCLISRPPQVRRASTITVQSSMGKGQTPSNRVSRKIIRAPSKTTYKYLTLAEYIAKQKTGERQKRTQYIKQKKSQVPKHVENQSGLGQDHVPKNKSIFYKLSHTSESRAQEGRVDPDSNPSRQSSYTSKSLPALKRVNRPANASAQYWRGLKVIQGPTIVRKVVLPSNPEYIKIIDANIRHGKKIEVSNPKTQSRRGMSSKENKASLQNTGKNHMNVKQNSPKVYRPSLHTQGCNADEKYLAKLLSETNQSIQVNTMRMEGEGHFPMKQSMHTNIKSSFYNKFKGKSTPVGKINSQLYNSISKMNLDTITERMMENLYLLMKDPQIKQQIREMGIDERKVPLLDPASAKKYWQSEPESDAKPQTQQPKSPSPQFNVAVIQPNVVMNIQTGLQNVNCQCSSQCNHHLFKGPVLDPQVTSPRLADQKGFFYKTPQAESTPREMVFEKYKIKEIVSMVADQIIQNQEQTEEELKTKFDKSIQISRVLEDLVEQNITRNAETSTAQEEAKALKNESVVFESNKRVMGSEERQFHLIHEINNEITGFNSQGALAKPKTQLGSRHLLKTDQKIEPPFYLKMSSHLKNYLHSDVQISDSHKFSRREGRDSQPRPIRPEEVDIQDTQIINHSIQQMGRAPHKSSEEYQSHINMANQSQVEVCDTESTARQESSYKDTTTEKSSRLAEFFSSKNISEVECQALSKMARKTKTIEMEKEGPDRERTERTLPHGESDTQFESRVKIFDFKEHVEKKVKESGPGEEGERRRREYSRITSETFNKMIQFKVDNRVRHNQEGGQDTFEGISNEILGGESMSEAQAALKVGRRRTKLFTNNVLSLNKFNSASGELVSGGSTPRENLGVTTAEERGQISACLEEIAEKTESNCKSQKTESNSNTGQTFYNSSRKKQGERSSKARDRGVQTEIKEEKKEGRNDNDKTCGTGLEEVQSGSTFFVGMRDEGEAGNGFVVSPENRCDDHNSKVAKKLKSLGKRIRRRVGQGGMETNNLGRRQSEIFRKNVLTQTSGLRRIKKMPHRGLRRNMTFGGKELARNRNKSKSCQNSFFEEEIKIGGRKRMISFKKEHEATSGNKAEGHPRINVDALEGTLSESSGELAGEETSEQGDQSDTFHGLNSGRSRSSKALKKERRFKMKSGLSHLENLKYDNRKASAQYISKSLVGRAVKPKSLISDKNVSCVNRGNGWPGMKREERTLGYNRLCSPKSSIFLKEFNKDVANYTSKSKSKIRTRKRRKVDTKTPSGLSKKDPKPRELRTRKIAQPPKPKETSSIKGQAVHSKLPSKLTNYSKVRRRKQPGQLHSRTIADSKGRMVKTKYSHRRVKTGKVSGLGVPHLTHTPKAGTRSVRFGRPILGNHSQQGLRTTPFRGSKMSLQSGFSGDPLSSLKSTKADRFENKNLTSLKKMVGGKNIPGLATEKKRQPRGNFTTIDDFSNNLRNWNSNSNSMGSKARNFKKGKIAKKSGKSTLLKIYKLNNFSAQSSFAEIKNKIKSDLKNFSSGNLSTRNNLSRGAKQGESLQKLPEEREKEAPSPIMEVQSTLKSLMLFLEFDETLHVESLDRNSELASIREEIGTLEHKDTYSNMDSSRNSGHSSKVNRDTYSQNSSQNPSQTYQDEINLDETSRQMSRKSSYKVQQGIQEEVHSLLAGVEFQKLQGMMKATLKEPDQRAGRGLTEWPVHTSNRAISPSSDTFVLKVNEQGDAVNIGEILSTAKEIFKIKKNIFQHESGLKLCSNLYITELAQRDLVLLRSVPSKGLRASKKIELVNPKALFPYLNLPPSFRGLSPSKPTPQSSDRTSPKTSDSNAKNSRTSNSNFYKRIVTEDYNTSGLAEPKTNREHFSFSQIQELKASEKQLNSQPSKKGSTAKVSLRYLIRNSEEREAAKAMGKTMGSHNVTSLHNSNKILKNFTSNSSKKYNLYEKKIKSGFLKGFMENIKFVEFRFPVLIDRPGLQWLLQQKGWVAPGGCTADREILSMFRYLFSQNPTCAVIRKFTNEEFVFYSEAVGLLNILCDKFGVIHRYFKQTSKLDGVDSLAELTRSLNTLTYDQKSALVLKESGDLLGGYFSDSHQNYLKIIQEKLAREGAVTFENFLMSGNIVDDFRVFWGLIENKMARTPLSVLKGSRMKLSTTEKKRGKKENLKILKAELRREKRKTKMALKSLNKKIEFVMEEDAKTYLQLKANKFDKREVYLAYERLKKKQGVRNQRISSALRAESSPVRQEKGSEIPRPQHVAQGRHFSTAPKTIQGVSQNPRRQCKSLSTSVNQPGQDAKMRRSSYHSKYLQKKSMSLEKGKGQSQPRLNKWLKKPEDIGNCRGTQLNAGNMRGGKHDTFYSEQKMQESLGSGFHVNDRQDLFGKKPISGQRQLASTAGRQNEHANSVEHLWRDSRVNTSDLKNPPSNFARKGMSSLLQMKTGSENLKFLLRRSRPYSPMTPVDPEIMDSFSSKANGSISVSNDDISDPSSDSETMSCFKGSPSPARNFASGVRRSNLSITKVKLMQTQPSITVVLNENIQCVIKLNGNERQQMSRLEKRYNLSPAETKKLKGLVEQASRGRAIDNCADSRLWRN